MHNHTISLSPWFWQPCKHLITVNIIFPSWPLPKHAHVHIHTFEMLKNFPWLSLARPLSVCQSGLAVVCTSDRLALCVSLHLWSSACARDLSVCGLPFLDAFLLPVNNLVFYLCLTPT